MFEGFDSRSIDAGDVSINCVVGGQGPAVLLLHGAPQCLAQWAKLAPILARDFTVVCADLRGYGDSSKPPSMPDASNYSFRTMAADQVRLMKTLGFGRFHLAGHDRGARVSHRLALDWKGEVLSLAVLDVVPTLTMYTHITRRLAATYWVWFFLTQPAPFPERLIGADPDYFFESLIASVGGTAEGLKVFDAELLAEYRRCWRDPAMIHGLCSDYRAGATIDLEHDTVDLARRVECPVLALWGSRGLVCDLLDIPGSWRERCAELRCASVAGGHWFPETHAEETAAILTDFWRGVAT